MPVGVSAAVSGAGSIIGGINSSNAAGDASKAAQAATAANNAAATKVYGTNTANEQPYVTSGQSANGDLADMLGVGSGGSAAQSSAFEKYLNGTNYQFTKDQGDAGINFANAPNLNSGSTLKQLDTFNSGLAGNALTGYQDQINNLANRGVTAAGALGQQGESFAAQTASNNNNAASAEGAADVNQANAENNALSGVTKTLSPLWESGIPSFGGAPSTTPTALDTSLSNGPVTSNALTNVSFVN